MNKNLKKLIALIIILGSLFGGFFVYWVINNNYGESYVTVTFDIDGEIIKKEVLRGSSVEIPEIPNKTGYHFVGWDNKTSFEFINKDQTFKALYEANKYIISFITNSDEEIEPITYEYNQEIQDFKEPIREGYEFAGWYYQDVLYEAEKMPAYNIELTALWYSTITFKFDGDLIFEPIRGIGDEYIEAPIIQEEAVKDGYKIVWYKDHLYQEQYTFNRMPKENLVLYGRYEEIKVVDPGFLDNLVNNELSNKIESYQQLVDYLEYMIYHRIEKTTELLIDYDVDNLQTAVNKAFDDINIDTYFKSSAKKDGNLLYITLTFDEEATQKASLTDQYIQLNNHELSIKSNRGEDFNNFKINDIEKTYKVTTSEQLYYVVERGYRPVFDEENPKQNNVLIIYNEAKNILRTIIADDMNDFEKVHAIYDWLVLNVTYDKRLKDYVAANVPNTGKYRGFYLEGVFLDQRAVCDGIAKAFVLLCRIEGIEAIRVVGVAVNQSFNHAWNKVRINDMWYTVDATSGGIIVGSEEIINHSYLFINDDIFGSMYVATTYTNVVSYGDYNIYKEMYFEYDGYTYDFNITSLSELKIIIKWYTENFDEKTTIDMRIDYEFINSYNDEIKAAMQGTNLNYLMPIVTENNILIIKEFQNLKKG